jgi:hypothetical protein
MIQSIDAEAVIKQAADYLRLGKAEPMRKRGGMGRRLELSIAVERLERFERPRLLIQHMIAERFGGLDEGFGEP